MVYEILCIVNGDLDILVLRKSPKLNEIKEEF